ncbi:MerR family transcriptional regulator [Pedobacter sp. Du54]|uniref:MerR family transcriptional regulator n=1 Tax=Pedobacter anseongensis TaxID=3133439 RepID=UPI0030AC3A31
MQYTISDLEQLSGIQSHTIRMWEQRYNALVPHRSAGNTRYYDDKQLLRLLNIVSISNQGLKISKVCLLSDDAMKQHIDLEISDTIAKDQQYECYISKLLQYGIGYNEIKFSTLLNQCIAKYEVSNTYKYIIYPLLVRLGLMWRKDSICAAQEHFLTSIIRQKLFVAIENLPQFDNGKTWLLFLPQEEEHEIGLLYANYALRKLAQKVIYLGPRVPLESVDQVFALNKINHILIFMVQNNLITHAQKYIDQLSTTYPSVLIHLAGNHKLISGLKLPSNVNWITSIDQFEAQLKTVKK